MENQEQLDIWKQGVQVWNEWRKAHLDIRPDFSYANLSETDLYDADLSYAQLNGANLNHADLSEANLSGADLSEATLIDAVLRGAILIDAELGLSDLSGVDLGWGTLGRANLYNTLLYNTNLSYVNLSDAVLSKSTLGNAIFGDVDLSTVKGLETVNHLGPSIIGIDTVYRSRGKIPEVFLKGVGVPVSFIEYMRSTVGSSIDYYSCFISYSSKDQAFAERLHSDLVNKGVRCWFAPEDMDIGDKLRPRIEESIRLYDKLLLVLSEHSIASNWVAYEVERALNKEPQGKPNVFYPIRLDDAVMETSASWADDIKSTRHIGDFTNWKNHDDYQKAFDRLLRALKAK